MSWGYPRHSGGSHTVLRAHLSLTFVLFISGAIHNLLLLEEMVGDRCSK